MISTQAALLYGPGQDYKVETVDLDEPRAGEVLVEMRACGLCHSDEHVRSGDLPLPHYPVINGQRRWSASPWISSGWRPRPGVPVAPAVPAT